MFTGIIIQKIDCVLLYLPNDVRIMFEKDRTYRIQTDSPVMNTPGSQLRIRITTKIRQNLKTFLGVSGRTKSGCPMTKTETKNLLILSL